MTQPLYLTLGALSLALTFSNCRKDTKTPEPAPAEETYTVPTTYNFSNASFTTSTTRLAMLAELTGYIRSAHTITAATQPTISAQKMNNMFTNAASSFTASALNTSGLQLKDQTSNTYTYVTQLESAFTDAEAASIVGAANPTISTASKGTKGKLVSPARAILVDANGLEYKELAEKGLMGALLFNRACAILNNISSYDNSSVVNGATAQERAWDEAFGYFGVPVDFPANLTGLKNWGTYCNNVNAATGSNATIMNAFLKGRAAISNKKDADRDAARNTVVATWEKVGAAKCIQYMKSAKTNIADDAVRNHNLSEGIGFINAFRYNNTKTISETQINTLTGYFGTNMYDVTSGDIDNIINTLATIYGLDANAL